MASTAVSSHIHALQAKHAELDQRLHQELARPIPDTATTQALKKQKLRLKEEIVRY
ncbi:YdcH family protein [Erythrobacter sp. NFXS35]|uniref:YdcH family protein n=1 Tax=Erythrobacter sp. NFXS35 TaxID=2818436 RepID=UPI0032DEDDB7